MSTTGFSRHNLSGQPLILFVGIIVACLALSTLLALAPYLIGSAVAVAVEVEIWKRCSL